jgi:hypothetical protein
MRLHSVTNTKGYWRLLSSEALQKWSHANRVHEYKFKIYIGFYQSQKENTIHIYNYPNADNWKSPRITSNSIIVSVLNMP